MTGKRVATSNIAPKDGAVEAEHDSAEVFNPADFSREALAIVQRRATGLLESGLLLADERSCVERIAKRCTDLLGEKRSARASLGNITETEIEEWKASRSGIPGRSFAARMAESIRNGAYYDSGGPIFPPDSLAFKEVSRETVENAMAILVERKMVRRSGDTWYIDEQSEPSEQVGRTVGRERSLRVA